MPGKSAAERKKVIVLRFGELWLRGKNRGNYITGLRRNLLRLLAGQKAVVRVQYDKMLIEPEAEADVPRIEESVRHLFGISNYEVAHVAEPNIKDITKASTELLRSSGTKSVRINAHRAYKGFDFNSIDITKKVAAAAEKAGVAPTLHGYSSQLFISVSKDAAYVSMGKQRAYGGLPVGSSGKGVVLLSGGIDSPVAAWYAMKRGISPIYLHFHGFSDATEAMRSKMPLIINRLAAYAPQYKVYYVPTHVFQLAAMRAGRYELILLKSFMLRVAELVARKEGAEAIFTGESLGQVASQTTSNMQAEQYGLRMQVLRPLIGFDKQEIISKANEIGTYEQSILPYKDVCSINSKNPATRTDVELMAKLARDFKISALARRSLKLACVAETG
jgi:thiamine biosynthesis protein ThiI